MAGATIFFQGRSLQVQAFLDTGNRLTDPVSGRPVSVIWAGALEGFFDGAPGVTLIPYRSVGKESGLLPAVKADCICIELEGKCRELKNPLIAVSQAPLSSDGSYEMLLHEAFWEKAVRSEKSCHGGDARTGKREKDKSRQTEGGQETEKSENNWAGSERLTEPETYEKTGKETERKNDAVGKNGTQKGGSEGKTGLENSRSPQNEDGGKSGRKEPENQSGGEKYGD